MLKMKNIKENQSSHVPFMLLDIILAQWWHPVASSEAPDLLYWEMRAVSYRRTTVAINMAIKVGACFVIVSFAVSLTAAGVI
jgi:hypothetical protein